MEKMENIIEILVKEYPDIEVSLDFENIYQLLVATMLSAQSTDKMVNSVTPDLFNKFPDIESLAAVEADDVVPFIKSIGLYNTKSKNLVKMARKVRDEYNGKIPNTMKGLTSLPGVGRKTANVVMGNGFGIKDSGITVDTHVLRLSQRIGLTENSTAKKVEKDLMEIVPKKYWVDITHYLISHGRKVCDARNPDCENCVISDYCDSAFTFD